MRIFIAALIPHEIRLAIKNYVESIKPHWSGVRWEDYNKFHITLKFLGELDETRLKDIEEIIKDRVRGLTPFRMKISGFAGFPSFKRPRVLVVVLSGNDQLLRFQQDLEGTLELIGYAREGRTFRSHITIGRIKGYSSARGSFPSPEPISFNISEIAIMRSILHKTGSEYTGLSVFTLHE